jgi:MtN3 and saliva related transmembrane protein
MNLTQFMGALAACCTTISFVPQAIKTIKTKNTTAISASMYGLFTFGSIIWAVYGVMDHSMPIIIANTTTAALALTILFYKIKELFRISKK